MTARRDDDSAGAAGRLRASRADREQAIEVLKVAFTQERLAKDEFDLRVGQALASRTYADLSALTADIPAEPASAPQLPEPTRRPGTVLRPKAVAGVSATGAGVSMAFVAVELVVGNAPAALGVILVGMTGLFVAGLLAALLTLLSWAVQRAQRSGGRAAQGPPSDPGVQASLPPAPQWQLPPAKRDPRQTAEAARTPSPRASSHRASSHRASSHRRLVPAVTPG